MQNMSVDTRLVQVRLPKPLALALKIAAAERDSSMQDLLREAVERVCSRRVLDLAASHLEKHPGDVVEA